MNAIRPRVSVIVPAYNSADNVRDCVLSITNQNLRDIEIVCVDDGSQDSTLDILSEISRDDSRIRVLTQPNSGAGAARNLGIAAARGDWLAFVDSDDVLLPGALARLVSIGDREGSSLVVSDHLRKYEIGGEARTLRRHWTLRSELVQESGFVPLSALGFLYHLTSPEPWAKLYRAKFIEDCRLRFPEKLGRAEDIPFFIEALTMGDRISVLNEATYVYRVWHNEGVNAQFDSHPLAILDALSAVRKQLKKRGVYDLWHVDFQHFAAGQILYALDQFSSFAGFRLFYQHAKNFAIDELDFKEAEFQGRMPFYSLDKLRKFLVHSPLEYVKWDASRLQSENLLSEQRLQRLQTTQDVIWGN